MALSVVHRMMPATVASAANPTEWFTRLYDSCDGWLTLFSIDRGSGEQHVDWAPVNQVDQLVGQAEQRATTCCVWFGVATRKQPLGTRRGGGDDCLHIPALWADIDVEGPNHKGGHPLPATIEAARLIINDFPLPPSAMIRSGGGLQPWWFLTEPIGVDEARELLRGWGATWAELGRRHDWHVDNVFDVARVMRLPGTTNRKTIPTPVTGKVCWDRRYQPSDFEPHLLDPPPAPEPGRIPYIGPERPGDAFNAVRRGGDVLGAAGFTFARTDRGSGEEHWTRPGKLVKDGASATVYADGHTTLWSDTILVSWPQADLRRPYDPFGLYTVLFCAGDFKAARAALTDQGYGTRARADDDFSWVNLNGAALVVAAPDDDNGIRPICWPEFWKRERRSDDWLIEPIIPRGRQVALWAPHKIGKSLITLELVAAATTGTSLLGQPPAEPITVAYFDMEMTEDDLEDRLDSLGYGPHSNLDRLHYYLLPNLPPLDTPAGAQTLLALIDHHQADLVIIDTMARVVTGEENNADTYRAFYRHVGLHLKTRHVALLRLDHAGKNTDLGQRGSSAKGDDVDLVWQLQLTDTGFELQRMAARMSWVPEHVHLRRYEDPSLRHELGLDLAWPAGTKALAETLDRIGVPADAGRPTARAALRAAGQTAKNNVLSKALKFRRQTQADPRELI